MNQYNLLVIFSIVFSLANAYDFSGSYQVKNDGAYASRFRVEFLLNGKETVYNTGNLVNGNTRKIEIPEGASNIRLVTELCFFISWWTEVFVIEWPQPGHYCFRMWGSTVHPDWEYVQC